MHAGFSAGCALQAPRSPGTAPPAPPTPPTAPPSRQVVSRDIRRILTQRARYFNIVLDDVSITQLTFRWAPARRPQRWGGQCGLVRAAPALLWAAWPGQARP